MMKRFGLLIMVVLVFAAIVPVNAQGDGKHFEMPEDAQYLEGIAYDNEKGVFYVGSALDGAIFRADVETGNIDTFVPSGRDGNTQVVGMKVDDYGRLWVAGGETRKIFVFDTQTSELLKEYEVEPAPVTLVGYFSGGEEIPANLLNDITIDPEGYVYVTDSYLSMIYRIAFSEDQLGDVELFLDAAGGGFYNGIAMAPDGEHLIVALADEPYGLRVVDIESHKWVDVALEGGFLSPDGILFDGDVLYATNFLEDGSNTVARVTFTADDYTTGLLEPAFITDDTFNVSTTLAVVGEEMLVVNSQMFTLFDPELEPVTPWIVSRVDIPAGE